MKCPVCGGAELVRDVREAAFTYKGRVLGVPAQPGLYCPNCGEAVFNDAETTRFEAVIRPFVQAVNQEAMPELAQVRKRLKLSQAEAGRLFGGGAVAFSRYETGKTQPPKALTVLFKLLEKHPELLSEVRG
jgi:HTH-type transcriptional regulator/antitoxin MqsA